MSDVEPKFQFLDLAIVEGSLSFDKILEYEKKEDDVDKGSISTRSTRLIINRPQSRSLISYEFLINTFRSTEEGKMLVLKFTNINDVISITDS